MRVKVTVTYDGKDFYGWQVQPKKRTVQDVIERKLKKIVKVPTTIHGSGRTDRGVHALSQIFHFDTDLKINKEGWMRALNSGMPDDIVITDVEIMDETFHARFSALFKTYEYRINTGSYNMYERDYVHQLNQPLSLTKLEEAMALFLGKHNFVAFNATELHIIPDQVRTITKFSVIEENSYLTFTIRGTGFLRYMVRMIIRTCIDYALGKVTLDFIRKAIENGDKETIKNLMPSHGLYLIKVDYPRPLHELTQSELWELFPIELVNNDKERWKHIFVNEKANLQKIIDTQEIYHIGSTAIENIKAKNIVDIMIVCSSKDKWNSYKNKLEELGYSFIYQNETRMHFNKGYTEHGFADEVIHLHITLENDIHEIEFVRKLNENPEYAKQYEILKEKLEAKYRFDGDGYTNAKTKFITMINDLDI